MTPHGKKEGSSEQGAASTAEDLTAMCVCSKCSRKIRFNINYAGTTAKCPNCGALLVLSVPAELEAVESRRSDVLPSVTGWVSSVLLHSLLLLSLSGITWLSGFGTGSRQRNVGIVVGNTGTIESAGEPASPIQAPSPRVPSSPADSVETSPIEELIAPGLASEMEFSPEMDMPGGGVAGPSSSDWENFAVGHGGAGGGGTASFFGLEARGRNFVYVVDSSGSMSADNKRQAAKSELTRSVHSLRRRMKFFIILYGSNYVSMPANGLVKATTKNKSFYMDWVKGIGSMGGTQPAGAMKTALSLKPDAIWLLSDGIFSERVCDEIRAANPGARVQIHTIAFHSEQGERVLRRIAQENRGHYRFVPSPGATGGGGRRFRRRR